MIPLGISITVGERDFKAVFGQQRQASLFHRMENAGKVTFVYVDTFYGNMDIVNCQFNGAVQNFVYWVTKNFVAYSTSVTTLLSRHPSCNETNFGTSFPNQGNAYFVVQLFVQMFKDGTVLDARGPSRRSSVLIITPYAVQKNYYDLVLDELAVAEVPKSLVEHCFWDSTCTHCYQLGHLAKQCTFQPTCCTCNGERHATHSYPRAVDNEIALSAADPVTADDGIERDALNPPFSKSAGFKRVKVSKAEREAAFTKPQTQKAAMAKDFRDALKRAMEATARQDSANDDQGSTIGRNASIESEDQRQAAEVSHVVEHHGFDVGDFLTDEDLYDRLASFTGGDSFTGGVYFPGNGQLARQGDSTGTNLVATYRDPITGEEHYAVYPPSDGHDHRDDS
ncbi:hypothetical protein FHETE_10888 [Fusarium heterosporum]|uniref:CCHC-type domain-containing protein n=1 Tax=Fusarium heterosporum TaxID=42747 RepID=A0A8H5SPH0_FUSHE|nr:hypothetical protein FHETE_10888 [Fusarium heterosporum]